MAVEGECGIQPSSSFEQMIGELRRQLANKQSSAYTPRDLRIITLLQLRDAWREHALAIERRHPLAMDPTTRRMLAGLRPVNLVTDAMGNPSSDSQPFSNN